jgi:L-alanine-DL-glutamate epimerase-like enolase superfamily enzyme
MAAIDMAAWDVLAKLAGLSLTRLLGGEEKTVPAYHSLTLGGIHQPSHSMSNWFSWSDASSGIQWLAPSICS